MSSEENVMINEYCEYYLINLNRGMALRMDTTSVWKSHFACSSVVYTR